VIGHLSLHGADDGDVIDVCGGFGKELADFDSETVRLLKRARVGLGSNVSTCDGPPFRKKWITRLALGVKCGWRGARAEVVCAAGCGGESACSRSASAREPSPSPEEARADLREVNGFM